MNNIKEKDLVLFANAYYAAAKIHCDQIQTLARAKYKSKVEEKEAARKCAILKQKALLAYGHYKACLAEIRERNIEYEEPTEE